MASLEPNYPFFALGIFKLEMAYFLYMTSYIDVAFL
jgi:hypothetical protein